MRKLILFVTFLLVFSLPVIISVQAANAQGVPFDPSGKIANTLGLPKGDLKATVIRFIQWTLGFLSIVAVILVIYGGFTWMTAGGNEEKVTTAKKILTSAIIGLVIILLSWAIIVFVAKTVSNVAK